MRDSDDDKERFGETFLTFFFRVLSADKNFESRSRFSLLRVCVAEGHGAFLLCSRQNGSFFREHRTRFIISR
jgi:hypothetical protein